MKLVFTIILLLAISSNSFAQMIELSQSPYLILKKYINNNNCYQSRLSFYGCIAGLDKLAQLKSSSLFLSQGLNNKYFLTLNSRIDAVKYYRVDLHSKYFVKALAEEFYIQESKFSFDKMLQRLSVKFQSHELLKVLNRYYAFRYDFHSYLSLDQGYNRYSLPLILKKVEGRTYVQFVLPYTVADYQRVQKGDEVLKINNISTRDLNESELRSFGTLDQSSFVTLDIQRNSQQWKVYFTTTENKSTTKIINNTTTYFRLEKIDNSTYQMISNSLKNNPVERIILDLRSVDGGYVKSALDISALFMKDSPWVNLYDIKTSRKSFIEVPPAANKNYKILILVDEETKSAAEMITGLVATTERALVIGRRTYGKGSVQKSSKWTFASMINEWRTFAFYRLPEWGKVQKYGIDADIELGEEISGSLREESYYLSLVDTGIEVNDYLKYPLRRSLMRAREIDCVQDGLQRVRWPIHKAKDRVLEVAINGLDCL